MYHCVPVTWLGWPSTSLRLRLRVSGELRAIADPSIELQAQLVLTERLLDLLCLSSSSSEPLEPWVMAASWAISEECGPSESSDLPHRELATLGEVDTENENKYKRVKSQIKDC